MTPDTPRLDERRLACPDCDRSFTTQKGRAVHRVKAHTIALVHRFWRNVDMSGDCWVWTGMRHPQGYGVISVNGRQVRAHRVAYELEVEPIPSGAMVNHHCDNPPCVRPDHLYIGDAKTNARDMWARGRACMHPPQVGSGFAHPRSKLTPEQLAEIRSAVAAGESRTSVAGRIGVHRTTVAKAFDGRSYPE